MTHWAKGGIFVAHDSTMPHINLFYFLPSFKFGMLAFDFALVFHQGYASNSEGMR